MNHKIIDVALAVIKDKLGRYLVAQRPVSTDYADYWEFPGGKREAGEDRLQVLQRECSEELGINVEHARPLFRWSYQYKVNAEGRHECRKPEGVSVEGALGYSDKHVRLDAWLIDGYSGEAHGAEGQQVRWLYPGEFGEYRFLEANKVLMNVLALPECCAITPEIGVEKDFYSQLDIFLSKNSISLLQFRAKNLSESIYKIQASNVVARCAEHNVTVMLNAEPAWAETVGDAGLHLPSQRLMSSDSRPVAKDRWLSASCHSAEELEHAERIGVDFVFLSPVLPTQSHPGAKVLGWEVLEGLVSKANIPVYALGGMTTRHLDQAQQLGCQGIASISEFWQ
ncbi:MAG: Nudix family hydrolase [Gammaproteobacteria bacterium]|nr:Nudix family hydrolase [Gammaproteobacteria bacterium]